MHSPVISFAVYNNGSVVLPLLNIVMVHVDVLNVPPRLVHSVSVLFVILQSVFVSVNVPPRLVHSFCFSIYLLCSM